MKSSTTLAERQEMMRERVKNRPCKDGRSRVALRARARLIRLDEVKPRTKEYVVKRRAARFMASRNYPRAYVANQLGISVAEVAEMLGEERAPGEAARDEIGRMEREKRREAKDPLSKILNPRNEVTFVPAFAGDVKALTAKQEAARREELAAIRERESRDAVEGRRG